MSDPSAAPSSHAAETASSDASERALTDEEYVDLLVHRRREDGVTYDDLAHMAGFLYQTDVSAKELEAVDTGERLPHIREQLQQCLRGDESWDAPSDLSPDAAAEAPSPPRPEATPDEPTNEPANEPAEESTEAPASSRPDPIGGQTLDVDPSGDLKQQYANYVDRHDTWYPNRELLSFDDFADVVERWDAEYYEAFNAGQVKESDWTTINELERLLCVPPASRLLVTAVAASQHDLSDDEATPNADAADLQPAEISSADAPSSQAEPSDEAAPSESASDAPEADSLAASPSDAPPEEAAPSPSADDAGVSAEPPPPPTPTGRPAAPGAPGLNKAPSASEADASPASTDHSPPPDTPQPAAPSDASPSDPSGAAASRRPDDPPIDAATDSISTHSIPETSMNTDDLLKGLRAQRNAIDVSLESIEERLEYYRQVRQKIDDAIELLEDDALAPLLGAVKELHGIAGGDGVSDADLPDRLARRLSDADDNAEAPTSRPSRLSS